MPTITIPDHWRPATDSELATALSQARAALKAPQAGRWVEAYFDPRGNYAGELFNWIPNVSLEPRDGLANNDITPADLLAVSMLNVEVHPVQVRQLLDRSAKRGAVQKLLRLIPAEAALHALDVSHEGGPVELLTLMDELQRELRETGPARAGGAANSRWVFAAKLAARKRPQLFPVRDRVVCRYLADAHQLSAGGIGTFRTDVQVFAHIVEDAEVRSALQSLLANVGVVHPVDGSVPPLRVLDVVLWMAGIESGYGARPRRDD